MLDVAAVDNLAIGLIGTGRLGKALALSLMDCGLRVAAVGSLTLNESAPLAAMIPGCANLTPQQVADCCDLVFITTTDGAIQSTADALRWRAGHGVVHCSGATEVSTLVKAARDGAQIGGFHPMQTFGDPEAARRSLPGCTITIEAEPPLYEVLHAIAVRLQCRVNLLPPGMRGRYHAAAAGQRHAGFHTERRFGTRYAGAGLAWRHRINRKASGITVGVAATTATPLSRDVRAQCAARDRERRCESGAGRSTQPNARGDGLKFKPKRKPLMKSDLTDIERRAEP